MKLKFILWFFSGIIFIAGCEKESSLVDVGTDPVIESIKMREKWNSADSTKLNKVEVKTIDPQGFTNLDGVFIEVKSQANNQVIFSDSLFDDGAYFHVEDGDVIAGDGVFSNRFSATQILSGSADGEYVFSFTAIDNEGHESQVAEQTATFGSNVRPEIVSINGPDTLFSGTSGQIFQAAVFDSDGVDDVVRVYFDTKDSHNQLIETYDLFNDGDFANHGDLFADDSIYAIKLDSTFGAGKLGIYRLEFHNEDSFNEDNIATQIHQIFVENKIGRFLNISVPDSIEKPSSPNDYNRELITARVSDPQGLADIDSVYFYSLKPDSSYANNGDPLPLVDNGLPFDIGDPWNATGDAVAGDGTFSLSILIFGDPSTQLGKYIFSFYIKDRGGNLSEVSKDSIMVY